MINDKEFKLAWQQGFDAAVKAHSGVVAAAKRVTDTHEPMDKFADNVITLTSALYNLKVTLKEGLDKG